LMTSETEDKDSISWTTEGGFRSSEVAVL